MPSEFKTIRRVEFVDTDMAGIMHFANFFRFMEAAEHEFVRSLGLSITTEIDGRRITFPRVHASCDYKAPLRYEDEVEIHVQVREKRAKSLTYDFTFRKVGTEEFCARGAITCVCVTVDRETGQMKATDIPPSISALFEPTGAAA